MTSRRFSLPLIELAPIQLALDIPPGGGVWRSTRQERQEGTGIDTITHAVESARGAQAELVFTGPTLVGLGDGQLREERARLEAVRDAAARAMEAIDVHLAMRVDWPALLRNDPMGVELEIELGPRLLVIALAPDGGVSAREYGGTVRLDGLLVRVPKEHVKVWHSRNESGLRQRLLTVLADLRFPDLPLEPLYPDERPSHVTVRSRDGVERSMLLPMRAIGRHKALDPLFQELDAIALDTQRRPADGAVPNPELPPNVP